MRKLVIANWKLNPHSLREAVKLSKAIDRRSRHTAVLCPPTVFLAGVDYPRRGAQDCFWEERGAFTGQTSPLQLKSLGVKYCLVGHSERRALGESDEQVNAKIKSLLSQGIIPVVCVGYGTAAQQDDMAAVDVLSVQLKASLAGLDTSRIIVAYEPVWAIGTGRNATPDHAEKIALFIKTRFAIATVLYGGSVSVVNAASFLSQSQIGGLLVGGESLIPAHFNRIINS